MAALVIAMKPGKSKPAGDAPMGLGMPKAEKETEERDDGSEFDAALDDFVKAIGEGDTSTAKEALGAAIAAKVAALTSEHEESEEPEEEGA